jgi:uncharacterized damage-inducible protein DinB
MIPEPEYFQTLFAYDAWANARTLDACAALTSEQLLRDLGSSFRSVRDTLAHILGAQWIWLERFHGRPAGAMPAAESYSDFAALRARWSEVERDLLAYVGALRAADLGGTLEYRTPKGTAFHNPLWQSLQHLANHGTYHRGQVAAMLRQLGAQAVSTDLIAFYRERAVRAVQQ